VSDTGGDERQAVLPQLGYLDLEGRVWNFSQHLRTTKPEDWGATPT
jgi:hypothetical protein